MCENREYISNYDWASDVTGKWVLRRCSMTDPKHQRQVSLSLSESLNQNLIDWPQLSLLVINCLSNKEIERLDWPFLYANLTSLWRWLWCRLRLAPSFAFQMLISVQMLTWFHLQRCGCCGMLTMADLDSKILDARPTLVQFSSFSFAWRSQVVDAELSRRAKKNDIFKRSSLWPWFGFTNEVDLLLFISILYQLLSGIQYRGRWTDPGMGDSKYNVYRWYTGTHVSSFRTLIVTRIIFHYCTTHDKIIHSRNKLNTRKDKERPCL